MSTIATGNTITTAMTITGDITGNLVLAPLVVKVIGSRKVWTVDKVISPVVLDPKVMLVNPLTKYPSSVAVISKTVSELLLLAPPIKMVFPLVPGPIERVDCP